MTEHAAIATVGLTKHYGDVVALGGVPKFTGELQEGMQATLARIKAAAERR